MKKRFTLILVLFINNYYFCFSQPPQDIKRADSVQIEYLTKELELTPDESEKLWPVYNNYKNEIRNIRKEEKADQIVLEEKVLNVRKKYKDDFKGILGSDERVNKLFVAEKNFTKLLQTELLRRRLQRQQ